MSDQWWRSAVVYQVYPRSFADADGDGLGDLEGLCRRLPYLADLGIDAVWLTPFYPSPLADGGYDISDHCDVDARVGTLADFDRLVAEAHRRGIRLLVDIVPNHTSEAHPWFQQALRDGPGSPARERYVFRRGRGPDGESAPTDWLSHFGGSAWQRVADGEWYLHLFAREQPDLNWDHPEVRAYFLDVLRFWADRGVDGFRVDVAHSLAKDLSEPLRSQPTLDAMLPLDGSDPLYDRDEVHEIYRSWRAVFDSYDPPKMAVAETWTPTNARTYLYARPDELGQVFDFSLLKSPWDRDSYQRIIGQSLADHAQHEADGAGLTWVLSSHDVPRHATRLGLDPDVDLYAWLTHDSNQPPLDVQRGVQRARAATLMMLALPGSAYLYQGEELGLPEVADLPVEALQDPIWSRTDGLLKGRDGCRVPLPWTSTGSSFGFGSNGSWLPQPPWFADFSVERQEADAASTLHLYRRALRLRRRLQTADTTVTWLDTDPGALHFRRASGWECLVNFGRSALPVPPGREVLLTSAAGAADKLEPDTAVWLRPLG